MRSPDPARCTTSEKRAATRDVSPPASHTRRCRWDRSAAPLGPLRATSQTAPPGSGPGREAEQCHRCVSRRTSMWAVRRPAAGTSGCADDRRTRSSAGLPPSDRGITGCCTVAVLGRSPQPPRGPRERWRPPHVPWPYTLGLDEDATSDTCPIGGTPIRAEQMPLDDYRKRTVSTTSSTSFFLSWYSEVEVPGNQTVRTSNARPSLSTIKL